MASEGVRVDRERWQDKLEDLLQEHGVVGASLGVLHRGEITAWAAGSLNLAEGIDATADSVFQIGSITKVWTATMVLQLVDEGRLDLDAPVVTHLPTVPLVDPTITARQLLNHTSGLQGDHSVDTGRGDDGLERYVDAVAGLPVLHAAGATMSYCNAGFSMLGRLIEVIDGRTWDASLRERLLDPLALPRSCTLPEEVLRFRSAVGHLHAPGQPPRLADRWGLPRAAGPAGLLCQPVGDLLEFARLHLADGRARDGSRLLSEESVLAMQTPSVDIPDSALGDQVGLGWLITNRDGRRLIGHTGTTIGQSAHLVVVPDAQLAVALLTNSDGHPEFAAAVINTVLGELAGLTATVPHVPVADRVLQPEQYVGSFAGSAGRLTVAVQDERLLLHIHPVGAAAPMAPVELRPFRGSTLLASFPGHQGHLSVTFYEVAGTKYLHTQGRTWPGA